MYGNLLKVITYWFFYQTFNNNTILFFVSIIFSLKIKSSKSWRKLFRSLTFPFLLIGALLCSKKELMFRTTVDLKSMAYSTRLEDYIFSLYQSIHIYEPEQLSIDLIASRLGIDIEYINGASQTIHMQSKPLVLINHPLTPEAHWQDFSDKLGIYYNIAAIQCVSLLPLSDYRNDRLITLPCSFVFLPL